MGRQLHANGQSSHDWLAAFPPIIVRLTARCKVAGNNVRALSNEELSIVTGIPLVRMIAISESMAWDDITISEAKRFCDACGFDPTNAEHRHRQRKYIESCQKNKQHLPPTYLRRSPLWPTQFLPLIRLLKSTSLASTGSTRSPSLAAR